MWIGTREKQPPHTYVGMSVHPSNCTCMHTCPYTRAWVCTRIRPCVHMYLPACGCEVGNGNEPGDLGKVSLNKDSQLGKDHCEGF